MAVFKCKMCGAPLEITENMTVAECEHCGVQQTLPRLTDEKRARLYDRANHFRRNDDFDKAASVYEQILAEDDRDAEAYWSLVLCRYGIEYVEDPLTKRRVPTVNRTQFTAIYDDDNYRSALQYAAADQRRIYEEEAAAINEIQKGILSISQKEEPFDVFICYKETDANGQRTRDSVLAQELYHELCEEGFKVFFARITLEDKLGVAYEPYIFAALNSAKVMVVLGTKPEYFNAVWVKNEWSRYLSMIKNGAKKMLIPAYRDMDPYDLPEEFSHLQAQDMDKLGFMQDLVRGICKIAEKEEPAPAAAPAAYSRSAAAPLLTRTKIFMDNGDWENANIKCEAALDIDPENAEAYIYKTMIALRISEEAALAKQSRPLEEIPAFRTALRYADDRTAERLSDYNKQIKERLKAEEEAYQQKMLIAERERRALQKAEQERLAKGRVLAALKKAQDDASFRLRSAESKKMTLQQELRATNEPTGCLDERKKALFLPIAVMALPIILLIIFVLSIAVDMIVIGVLSCIAMCTSFLFVIVFGVIWCKKRTDSWILTILILWFTSGFAAYILGILELRDWYKKYGASYEKPEDKRERLTVQLKHIDAEIEEARVQYAEAKQKYDQAVKHG